MLSLYKTIENIKKLAFQGIYKKPYNLSKKAQLANEPVQTTAPSNPPIATPAPVKYEPKYADYIESYIYNNRENLQEGLPLSPLPPQIRQEILNNPEERNVYKKLVNSILGSSAAQSFNNQLFGGELDSADSRFVTNPVNNLQSQQPQRVSEPDYSSDNSVYKEVASKLIATGKLNYLISDIKSAFELYGNDKLGDDSGRANSYLNERVNYGFGSPQTPLSVDNRVDFFLSNEDLLPQEIKNFMLENASLKRYQLHKAVMQKFGKQIIEKLKMLVDQASMIDSTDKLARESNPIFNWINKSVRSGLKGKEFEKAQKGDYSLTDPTSIDGKQTVQDTLSNQDVSRMKHERQDDKDIVKENKKFYDRFSSKITGFFVKKCISNVMNDIQKMKNTVVEELEKRSLKGQDMAERLDFYVSSAIDSAEKLLNGDESLHPKINHLPDGTISYRNDLGHIEIPREDVEQASIYIKNRGMEDAKINAESDEAELARMRGEQNDYDPEVMYTDANMEKYTNEYINDMSEKPEWDLNWGTLFSRKSVKNQFREIGRIKSEIKNKNSTSIDMIRNDPQIASDLNKLFKLDENKKNNFIQRTINQSPDEINKWIYAEDPKKGGLARAKEQFKYEIKHYLNILYPLRNGFSGTAKKAFIGMMYPHGDIVSGKYKAIDKDNKLTYTEMYKEFIQDNNDEQNMALQNSPDPEVAQKQDQLRKKLTELRNNPNKTEEIKDKIETYRDVLELAREYQDAKGNLQYFKDTKNKIKELIEEQKKYRSNILQKSQDKENQILSIQNLAKQQNRPLTTEEEIRVRNLKTDIQKNKEVAAKRFHKIKKLYRGQKGKNKAVNNIKALNKKIYELEKKIDDYSVSKYNIKGLSFANSSTLRVLLSMLNKTEFKIASLSSMQIKFAKIDPHNNVINNMIMIEFNKFKNVFDSIVD